MGLLSHDPTFKAAVAHQEEVYERFNANRNDPQARQDMRDALDACHAAEEAWKDQNR